MRQVILHRGLLRVQTNTVTWNRWLTRQVYLINGQQPAHLIDINEGDDLEVFVQNDLPVASTIHWHGEYPITQPGKSSGLKLSFNRHESCHPI